MREKGNSRETRNNLLADLLRDGAFPFEKLVLSQYSLMPKSIRIGVFLVCFFVIIYSWMLPTVLPGRLVAEAGAGPIQRFDVWFWVGSNRAKASTNNEEGSWAVPMFRRLPLPIKVEFSVEGSAPQEVTIEFWRVVWSRLTDEPIRIELQKSGSTGVSYRVVSIATLGIKTAVADTPLVPNSVDPLDTIEQRVALSVAQASHDTATAAPATTLIAERILNPLDRALLLNAIRQTFKLDVSDLSFTEVRSIQELAKWIRVRQIRSAAILRELPELLKSFRKSGSFYTAPDFDRAKIDGARKSMSIPTYEPIVAQLDATVFGSAAQGMVLTSQGLYFENGWARSSGPRSGFIPYSDLVSRDIRTGSFEEISLGNGQVLVIAGSSLSRDRVLELLSTVKSALVSISLSSESAY
jgi:hypothetical protein